MAKPRLDVAARRDVVATTLSAPRLADRASPSPTQLPLERKLPLLVLALFSIILGAWAVASYYETRRAAEAAAGERLSTLARIVGATVETLNNMRLTALSAVARDTAVQSALRSPDHPLTPSAQRVLAALVGPSTNALGSAQLWTPDGQVAGDPDVELVGDARAFRDKVLRAPPATRDSVVVGPLHTTSKQSDVWVAATVRGADHQPLGYVVQQRRFGASPQVNRMLRDLIGS